MLDKKLIWKYILGVVGGILLVIALLGMLYLVSCGEKKVQAAPPSDYTEFGFRTLFPVTNANVQYGITMRDYIAIQAMNGLVTKYGQSWGKQSMANLAYEMADAMMVARDARYTKE